MKFWSFAINDDNSREKRQIDRIRVSAGINLDYGYTKQFMDKNKNNDD